MKALRGAEFLLGNKHVSGQSPLGSKCQDEKEGLDSGNEELLELLEFRSEGLGNIGVATEYRVD